MLINVYKMNFYYRNDMIYLEEIDEWVTIQEYKEYLNYIENEKRFI